LGATETTNEIALAYVGEAEEIYPRLQQHQDRDFSSEALIFVSKDENLNKAHLNFLREDPSRGPSGRTLPAGER
jgi:hypothetical protein